MENLILITVGLFVLTVLSLFRKQPQVLLCTTANKHQQLGLERWFTLEYSTSSISHKVAPSSSYTDDARVNEEAEDDLSLLDKTQLLKKKVELENQLKNISKKLLKKEREELNQRLEEIDEEMNS